MKENQAFFLAIFIFISVSLFFSGCNKTDNDKKIPLENTTEVVSVQDINKVKIQKENIFELSDLEQNTLQLTMTKKDIIFSQITQPIVIIHFFHTEDSPIFSEIPYLIDLQNAYKKDVFVLGVLMQENNSSKQGLLKLNNLKANYFISYSKSNRLLFNNVLKNFYLPPSTSTPMTLLYKNGTFMNHYEGAVPIEMLKHTIKQLLKKV
ncbi:MAG: hypothetical protein U9O24_08760 [Campylobacterota bacterium]|nr:hypothetical protein [Campylobacterota bacterium]